jgi:hypothetical protein
MVQARETWFFDEPQASSCQCRPLVVAATLLPRERGVYCLAQPIN